MNTLGNLPFPLLRPAPLTRPRRATPFALVLTGCSARYADLSLDSKVAIVTPLLLRSLEQGLAQVRGLLALSALMLLLL